MYRWRRLLCPLSMVCSLMVVLTWQYDLSPRSAPPCELSDIQDYVVWLKDPLNITFNFSGNCAGYVYGLYKDNNQAHVPTDHGTVNGVKFFTFMITNVTKDFDNASLKVIGTNGGHSIVKAFTIHTQDKVCHLTNASIVVTCSHLVACWQQQPDCQGGLYVDNFGYQLTNGTSVVEGGDVTSNCVSFNLSTTMPNVDGYMLSIWGQASPGNGPPATLKAIAAKDPVVKYSYDVAIVEVNGQERAVLLLAGMVNHGSCPTKDPTEVFLHFSCGSYSPVVQLLPVRIASSNTTEVIQSDPIEAGHRNCKVTVVSKNLSGKTVNDSHTFDTTDVQMFDAQPLNGVDNLGAINCSVRVAINSSVLELMVNISGSSGRRFGAHVVRTIGQRVVSGTTMMLPVDIYTLNLSVLTSTGFQYSNFSKRVNITRSNYSIPTSTPTPSSTPISPTRVTTGNAWIAGIVVSIVVIGIVVVALVAVCLCRCCKPKRQVETVDYEENFSHASFVEDKKSYEAAAELSSVASDTDDEESQATESVQLPTSTTGAQSSQTLLSTTAVSSSLTREAPSKTSPPITEDEQLPSSTVEYRPLQTSPSTVEYRPLQTSPSTVEYRPLQTSSSAVEDRPLQTFSSAVEDRPSQTSPSAVEDRPPHTSPSTVVDRPPQTAPSTVEDRPPQTSPSTCTEDRPPKTSVEHRPSQTSPSSVYVDDGSPPPAVEDRPPKTSPSAVAVVQEQASIPIANMMGLMENRPLFITSTQDLPVGVVVTRMDSHTGMSPDPTSTTADSEKALLPATSTPPPVKHKKQVYHKPSQAVTYSVQETTTTTADSEKALLPSPSTPPPVQRARHAHRKPAHRRPAQEVAYPVQETTTTADSEKALLPPTPPPLYVRPEPVASHPVQVTTTTDDSEKALLFSSSLPTSIILKKQLSEGHPVQETDTTTTEERIAMPSSLIVPTQLKPEASFFMQQTTTTYATSGRSRTLSLPIPHAHSRPVVSRPVGQQPKPHDEEVESYLTESGRESTDPTNK